MKIKKWPKLDECGPKFIKLSARLALGYVQITQCQECYHPVIDGHTCNNCGNTQPSISKAEQAKLEAKYSGIAKR